MLTIPLERKTLDWRAWSLWDEGDDPRSGFFCVSSPSQAQFAKNYNAKMLSNVDQTVVDAIGRQHYVDDYVHCSSTIDEAVDFSNKAVELALTVGVSR